MKNKTKTFVVIAGILSLGVLNSKKDAILKDLIDKTWNETVKDKVMFKLNLNQVPTLKYEKTKENKDSVMYTTLFHSYSRSMFGITQYIDSSTTNYNITINLSNVWKYILSICGSVLYIDKEIICNIIEVLLYHECRHMWQAQTNFYKGFEYNHLNIERMFKKHGLLKEEIDANDFAIECMEEKKKHCIAEFNKIIQESVGGTGYSPNLETAKAAAACIRNYNPIVFTLLKLIKKIIK